MSTTIYINRDDTGHVQAVSTTYTSATNNEAVLEDSTFYFDKIEGYKATYDTEGKLHVTFDQTQYDAYTKAQAEAEAKAKEAEEKQDSIDTLAQGSAQIMEAISAVRESLDDATASKHIKLFDSWQNAKPYTAGERIVYDGKLYKVLQGHTSQDDWTPGKAPSLFSEVLTSTVSDDGTVTEDDIKDWVQPDSTNAYKTGDKVRYNGKTYESLIDNNTWSPEAYPAGWKEV